MLIEFGDVELGIPTPPVSKRMLSILNVEEIIRGDMVRWVGDVVPCFWKKKEEERRTKREKKKKKKKKNKKEGEEEEEEDF